MASEEFNNGRLAAQKGQGVKSCPYPHWSVNSIEWMKGYLSRNPRERLERYSQILEATHNQR